MLHIETFTVNFIQENCYVVSDETREAVVIDCGAYYPEEQQRVLSYLRDHALRPVHLLCTHGHFDHVFGLKALSDAYGLGVTLHAADVATYEKAEEQLMLFMHKLLPIDLVPVTRRLQAGDTVTFGTHTLRVIHTPGHTPGGVCYYSEQEQVIFTGDSLFRHSIGRTDLPGSTPDLDEELRQKVLVLPPETRVLTGHGDPSYIGEEQRANPYL